MSDFFKSKLVVFIISLMLGGVIAVLISFLLFYLIAMLIGNYQNGWMIFNLLISAILLIAIFAIATKKIHFHLKRFSEDIH